VLVTGWDRRRVACVSTPRSPSRSWGLEAHLSFWGEPFMSRATGRDMPRYIFHVQRHSELIGRLVEIQRLYRLE